MVSSICSISSHVNFPNISKAAIFFTMTILMDTNLSAETRDYELESLELSKATVMSTEAGGVLVHSSIISPDSTVELVLRDRLGKIQYNTEMSASVNPIEFTIPAMNSQGPLLLTVQSASSQTSLECVYPVVDNPSQDIRYGFYTEFENPSEDFESKAQIFTDLYLNAVEYYDYFPGHGDYAPEDVSYTNQPFNFEVIHTDNINGKAQANRDCHIKNIAYIAAYSAIPEIASITQDYLLNEEGIPLVFYNGDVGTAEDLGGTWFQLMGFAPDTQWFQYLESELSSVLDDSPNDRVRFEGFEVDTYGYQGLYQSSGSAYNGQSIAAVLAEFCGLLRQLTKSVVPGGIVTTNTIAEDYIETVYDKVDFLFVENWAYHKPRYEDVVKMVIGNKARSGLRLISKSYPADTDMEVDSWPATNLKYLMGCHLAGGGSLMVAGEPNETTGQVGGLNTLYYPDYELQSEENYQIIKNYNAHDAALYLRNHGETVRPLETDFTIENTMTTAFRSDDGAVTWCFLQLGDVEKWTQLSPVPPILIDSPIELIIPNRIIPCAVLFGSPDTNDYIYPQAIDYNFSGGQLTATLPYLEYFSSLLIEPMALDYRARDIASNDIYEDGWGALTNGGTGWSDTWEISSDGDDAGVFIGDSTCNGAGGEGLDGDINHQGVAWGIYSGLNGSIQATRRFEALETGEAIALHLDNGWIVNNGKIGFQIGASDNQSLFSFEFIGGESNYRIIDASGIVDSEIPFTDDGLDIELTMVEGQTYNLRIVPIGMESKTRSFEGDLIETSSYSSITSISIYAEQTGSGEAFDLYFNDLAIFRPKAKEYTDMWRVL